MSDQPVPITDDSIDDMIDRLVEENARLRHTVAAIQNTDYLTNCCRQVILNKHATLWQDWIVEPDKVLPDGTVVRRGLTKASEWLAATIREVLALTVDE